MTITEKFQNKRCVFSIECFPPKQTTQMDKLKDTLQKMQALTPGFISVTFGAGGSAGGVSTNGRVAVVLGIVIVLVISIVNSMKKQEAKTNG